METEPALAVLLAAHLPPKGKNKVPPKRHVYSKFSHLLVSLTGLSKNQLVNSFSGIFVHARSHMGICAKGNVNIRVA